MSFFSKKIITLFILTSFLLVASFGFIVMAHGSDGSMLGDCPISAGTSSSLCALGTLDMVIYHISAYHSFLGVPANYGVMAFILTIVFFVATAIIFIYLRFIVPLFSRRTLFYSLNSATLYKGVISGWLSLLEHSPSQ